MKIRFRRAGDGSGGVRGGIWNLESGIGNLV
jgi:hypothetical protein